MMFCASDERSCAARPHQPGPHRPLVSAIPASGIPVSHRIYKGTRWQRAFAATSRILALHLQGSPDRLRTWPHLGNLRGRCATPPSRLPSRRHGAWQNYCAPRSKKSTRYARIRESRPASKWEWRCSLAFPFARVRSSNETNTIRQRNVTREPQAASLDQ